VSGPARPPAQPLRDRLRGSLQTRVYLLVMWTALGPVAILSWAFATRIHRLDDQLLASRQWAARAAAGQAQEELIQGFEVLQRAATAARVDLEDPDRAPEHAALRDPRVHLQFPGGAFFLDARGNPLAEEPERGTRSWAPTAATPGVLEVLRSARPAVTPLVNTPSGTHAYQLVPVRDWEGRVTGLAGGVIDTTQHHLLTLLRYLRRGPEGSADVVDQNGRVVAGTDPGSAGRELECAGIRSMVAEHKDSTRLCRDCHRDRSADARGRAIVAVAAVGNAPWSMVARLPESEVLTPTGVVPEWLGLLTAAALALGALLAWGAARSIAGPVSRLTSAAEGIAGGDLNDPIPQSGWDEVGRLGAALEKMRTSLRDLIGVVAAANQRLEQRVEERTAELARVNDQLRQREDDLARLYEKVVAAQEDERKRIARELHDDTSQSLAVLVMAIDSATATLKSGKTPRLEEARALAVRTIEEVHRMILDLRPSVLDDLGLQSAIRWYAERHLVSRGLSVRCEFEARDRRWPAAFETAVFRICQEAMSNIARHAEAESVLIQVAESGGMLRIEIEDDGKGFDPGSPGSPDRRHFGLMGIRERVEILGGTVTIDSAPGQGTRLRFEVPLPREE
jgi:signal transduction histidine kinase